MCRPCSLFACGRLRMAGLPPPRLPEWRGLSSDVPLLPSNQHCLRKLNPGLIYFCDSGALFLGWLEGGRVAGKRGGRSWEFPFPIWGKLDVPWFFSLESRNPNAALKMSESGQKWRWVDWRGLTSPLWLVDQLRSDGDPGSLLYDVNGFNCINHPYKEGLVVCFLSIDVVMLLNLIKT